MSVELQRDAPASSQSEYSRALRTEGKRLVAKGRSLLVESNRIRANAKDVARRAAEAIHRADTYARRL